VTLFRIISAEKGSFPVGGQTGGHASRMRRGRVSLLWLTEQIRQIWASNRKVYRARRVHADPLSGMLVVAALWLGPVAATGAGSRR
jgi:hypothetical protein